jgi:hypothetical protein
MNLRTFRRRRVSKLSRRREKLSRRRERRGHASRLPQLQPCQKVISAKNRLHRLHAAVPQSPLAEPLRKSIRDAAKTWFDILKNFLVVAGIFYMSAKINSYSLRAVAWVSLIVLVADCTISPILWAARLNRFLVVALAVALFVCGLLVDEFVRAQLH